MNFKDFLELIIEFSNYKSFFSDILKCIGDMARSRASDRVAINGHDR